MTRFRSVNHSCVINHQLNVQCVPQWWNVYTSLDPHKCKPQEGLVTSFLTAQLFPMSLAFHLHSHALKAVPFGLCSR